MSLFDPKKPKPPPPAAVANPIGEEPFDPRPTPSGGIASVGTVKAIVTEAVSELEQDAKTRAWKQGWATGIGVVAAVVAAAFGGLFKLEAMAQEKVDAGVALATAQTDAKLARVQSDIDTLKYKVDEQNKKLDDVVVQNKEIIELLKKKK